MAYQEFDLPESFSLYLRKYIPNVPNRRIGDDGLDQLQMTDRYSSAAAKHYLDRVKRIWYLSRMRAAKVQASLRIRAVSPEPSLLAHTGSESRGTFRQKARSLAPLNGWACAVKMCHDGMLEDTNSLDGAHFFKWVQPVIRNRLTYIKIFVVTSCLRK